MNTINVGLVQKPYEVARLGHDYGTSSSITLFADSRNKAKGKAIQYLKCDKKDLKCRILINSR